MSISFPALAAQMGESTSGITLSDFEQVVRSQQRRIYRVLLLMLKDAGDADNLTQECFLRAYESRDRFRGECSLQTWLMRIAVNLARDHVRNRRIAFWKRLVRIEQEDTHAESDMRGTIPSPERGLIAREQLDAVWRAVEQLSQRQREVFILRFVEEMELKEIGEVLNLSTGTIKAQLFRAVSRVKERVGR